MKQHDLIEKILIVLVCCMKTSCSQNRGEKEAETDRWINNLGLAVEVESLQNSARLWHVCDTLKGFRWWVGWVLMTHFILWTGQVKILGPHLDLIYGYINKTCLGFWWGIWNQAYQLNSQFFRGTVSAYADCKARGGKVVSNVFCLPPQYRKDVIPSSGIILKMFPNIGSC